jgi:hypothetical protein
MLFGLGENVASLFLHLTGQQFSSEVLGQEVEWCMIRMLLKTPFDIL